MKQNIHPDYHEITVVMTDGSSFKTRSTLGKAGDTLRLDIDPKSHPAWTGQHRDAVKGDQITRFRNRFGSLGASSGAAAAPADTGKKAEKAAVSAAPAEKAEKKAPAEKKAKAEGKKKA